MALPLKAPLYFKSVHSLIPISQSVDRTIWFSTHQLISECIHYFAASLLYTHSYFPFTPRVHVICAIRLNRRFQDCGRRADVKDTPDPIGRDDTYFMVMIKFSHRSHLQREEDVKRESIPTSTNKKNAFKKLPHLVQDAATGATTNALSWWMSFCRGIWCGSGTMPSSSQGKDAYPENNKAKQFSRTIAPTFYITVCSRSTDRRGTFRCLRCQDSHEPISAVITTLWMDDNVGVVFSATFGFK